MHRFCECFYQVGTWSDLMEEIVELVHVTSWNELVGEFQDVLWGIWKLLDRGCRLEGLMCGVFKRKARKHLRRMQERGCFRSERHPKCGVRRGV